MTAQPYLRQSYFAALVLFSFVGTVNAQGLQPPTPPSPTATETGVVNEAGAVLQQLSTSRDQRIPEKLLTEAAGIAIVPHFKRGAFVIGVSGGRGVLLTKDPNGNWLAPEFISMGGGSLGWQAGIQSVDLVLVFRTPQSLNNIRNGKLTLGVDATATAGPVGRYTSAATDANFKAEIYTYSQSRGLFAGVSLGGSAIQLDVPATQRYYDIASGNGGTVPPSAYALVNELVKYSNPVTETIPPAGTTTFPTGETRLDPSLTNLAQSVLAMQARVDTQWQQYLALPAEWKSGQPPTLQSVHSMLIRYERVETNPQFESLRQMPEFQSAVTELRRLAGSLATDSNRVVLPPPPGN